MIFKDPSGVPVLIRKMGDRYPKALNPGRPPRRVTLAKQRKMIRLNRRDVRELNGRQMKALKNYVELGATVDVKHEAAVAAGYPPATATAAMNRVLEHPVVHRKIVDALDQAGVTDEKIATVIAGGLDAHHPFRPKYKDWATIEKFARQANQLRDNFPETRIRTQSETRQIVINMSIEDAASYKRYLELQAAPPPALPEARDGE